MVHSRQGSRASRPRKGQLTDRVMVTNTSEASPSGTRETAESDLAPGALPVRPPPFPGSALAKESPRILAVIGGPLPRSVPRSAIAIRQIPILFQHWRPPAQTGGADRLTRRIARNVAQFQLDARAAAKRLLSDMSGPGRARMSATCPIRVESPGSCHINIWQRPAGRCPEIGRGSYV